jgi:hypothetical protein
MRTLHIADPDCPETKTGYVTTRPAGLTCAADHPAEPVRWLWQHRIPLGKVTLHAGDPGLGKSLLASTSPQESPAAQISPPRVARQELPATGVTGP